MTDQLEPIYRDLRVISWFSHVGEPLRQFECPLALRQVACWQEARRFYGDPSWESTTLQARNALTGFLSVHHPERDRLWNDITLTARDGFLRPLIQERVVPYQRAQNLDQVFLDCVLWDLLGAIMEFAYRDLPRRPT